MASTPLPSIPTEQRVLAAIVFTDVVGFSARMQKEESNTLRHLERDFITMREFSAMHGGRVIKTTGDGLLLYFTSAVHAVEWSLQTQRHFAEQSRTYPPAEILQHRVGVHLGDVFLKGDDVMGDGVNIAARVQSEAPTAGICISQAVYDVVKNKLKLHVIRLETRKLKNISEVIQIYSVLLEPPRPITPIAVSTRVEPAPPPPASTSVLPKLAVVTLLVLAMGVVAALLVRAHSRHQKELAESQAAHDLLGAALQSKKDGAPDRSAPVSTATEEFDFAKMTGDRPAAELPAKDERMLQRATECMQALDAWMITGLQRYTKDQPLPVRRLRNPAFQDLTVFTDPKRQLYFSEGGAIRKRNWEDLGADIQAAIVVSALRASPMAPSRDVVRGAEAFAFVHGQSEMARALMGDRRSRAGSAP